MQLSDMALSERRRLQKEAGLEPLDERGQILSERRNKKRDDLRHTTTTTHTEKKGMTQQDIPPMTEEEVRQSAETIRNSGYPFTHITFWGEMKKAVAGTLPKAIIIGATTVGVGCGLIAYGAKKLNPLK